MKIAVVGCGAVGSYYGARLARSGQDVHFLLRSDYEFVRRNGVFVRSPKGDFRVRPKCARSPEAIGPSDLVLIGLKTTANDQFSRLLPPLVAPHTALLTLQNGLGNEEQLAQLFPPAQIMGGLCFVCLNRIEPGIVHHIDHGLVVLGEFQRWPEPRTHDIATLFRNAGVPCTVSDDLARSHWEKLVWNIPFNGLGVAGAAGYDALIGARRCLTGSSPGAAKLDHTGARPSPVAAMSINEVGSEKHPRSAATPAAATGDGRAPPKSTEARSAFCLPHSLGPCLTTDKLLADPRWEALVRELMAEVIAAACALGFKIEHGLADKQVERTRTMAVYKASTLVDFERGRPLELENLFFEPLRRAQRAGVPTPRLAALCALLKALDEDRTASSQR